MGKNNNYDKEIDSFQKLKAENKKLKTQIAKLRKVISRLDFEQYSNIKELLESQEAENLKFIQEQTQLQLDRKWKCFKCHSGVLRLVLLYKMGKPFYIRKCDSCTHKTKIKPYTGEVEK